MAKSMRPYLEYQADRVEAVLAAHRAPARITGGTVGPRLIRFFLEPAPYIRLAAIRKLADDLALALHVPALRVDLGEEGVVLEFANPHPHPVKLPVLLEEVGQLPVATALLGLTQDGMPLLARLSSPDVAHILVSGTTGSGKSVLLRTLILTMLLSHTPETLRLLCIDPKGRAFTAFDPISYFLRPPVTDIPEAIEALNSLVRTMEARDRYGEVPATSHRPKQREVPHVVVVVDELADLIMQGGKPVTDAITRLAQRGRESGIHLVVATQRPSAAILGSLMRSNFPLRLVGKVVSAQDARVASGRAGTGAHMLNGRGDFLAVGGSAVPIRFQVAFVSKKEQHALLSSLSL